jgi:hypothetical protein
MAAGLALLDEATGIDMASYPAYTSVARARGRDAEPLLWNRAFVS